jgi:hypothetical protein
VAKDKDDAADDKNHRDDDDQNDKDPGDKDKPPQPPPKPPGPPPSSPPPAPAPTSGVSVTQTVGRRWPGRRRRYAQAEYQPADRQSAPASYSTGPGAAEEYHYHRTPTYHHQYAAEMTQQPGAENNPT